MPLVASALAPRDARFTGMRGAGWVGWVACRTNHRALTP